MAFKNYVQPRTGVLLVLCVCLVIYALLSFIDQGAFVDSWTKSRAVPEPQGADLVQSLRSAPVPSLESDRSQELAREVVAELSPTLRIAVRDPEGGPISDCSVSTGGITTSTDQAGRAELTLPPGRTELDFQPGDQSPFEPLRGVLLLPGRETKALDVVLRRRPSFRFCVEVRSSADNSPLANVEVCALGETTEVRTDELGRACLESAGIGQAVGLFVSGFATQLVRTDPGHETLSSALQVRLQQGAALAVRVVDEAGRCIPDADVEVHLDGVDQVFPKHTPLRVERTVLHGERAANEHLHFVDLPRGVVFNVKALLAKDWLGSSQRRVVLRDSSTVLTMTLRPFRCVRGRVLDESGAAVAGVVARAKRVGTENLSPMADMQPFECFGDSAPTDLSGEFVIPHVGPGSWFVGSVGLHGVMTMVQRVDVSLDADAWVELKAISAESIAGVVVSDTGVPCRGVELRTSRDGILLAWDETDEDGRFQLEGLPSGEYELEGLGIPSLRARTGAHPLTIQRSADTTLTGKLPAGLWSISASGEGTIEGESDLDGSFRLGPVPQGSWWNLYLSNGFGRVAMIRVQADTQLQPIVVDPKLGAWLYLSDPEATNARIRSEACALDISMVPGATDWVLVPGGMLSIEFRREDGSALSKVLTALKPGEKVLVTRDGRLDPAGAAALR